MVELFKSGLWIPFLILLMAVVLAFFYFFRHLRRFRQGSSDGAAKLNEFILGNLVEIEHIKEGEALMDKGSHEEAVTVLERSKKLNPTFPLTLYLLGKVYLALGDKGQSLDSFCRYVEMATGYDEMQKKRISDAKNHISEAQEDKNPS